MTQTAREKQTVTNLIALYCLGRHGQQVLCAECQALQDYAMARLDRCPWGEEKPTCAKCSIHCYKPHMRQRIRVVMRYAGPRMLLRYPAQYLRHWLKERLVQVPTPRKRG